MYFNREDIMEVEHEVIKDFVDEESTEYNIGQISGVLRFVDALLKKGDEN